MIPTLAVAGYAEPRKNCVPSTANVAVNRSNGKSKRASARHADRPSWVLLAGWLASLPSPQLIRSTWGGGRRVGRRARTRVTGRRDLVIPGRPLRVLATLCISVSKRRLAPWTYPAVGAPCSTTGAHFRRWLRTDREWWTSHRHGHAGPGGNPERTTSAGKGKGREGRGGEERRCGEGGKAEEGSSQTRTRREQVEACGGLSAAEAAQGRGIA